MPTPTACASACHSGANDERHRRFCPLAVLIVDDEAPARELLRDVLGDIADTQPTRIAGTAANGVEALALLEHETVDLILTDIRMPVMDGVELARHGSP